MPSLLDAPYTRGVVNRQLHAFPAAQSAQQYRSPSLAAGRSPALSDRVRERLRHLAALPARRPLDRLNRPRVIDVNYDVELVCQASSEVMALPLGVGSIDDPDSALQARRAERFGGPGRGAERDRGCLFAGFVEELFDAATQCRPYPLSHRRRSPIVRGGDRSGVGGEANQDAVA